jgi:hypothetical protein
MRSVFVLIIAVVVADPRGRGPEGPRMDAHASEVLRTCINTLHSAKRIRFHAQIMSDQIGEDGVRLQRGADVTLWARQPDKLRADVIGDGFRRAIWYDGSRLTIYDPVQRLFARFKAPATIAGTVSVARNRFGLDVPLAQLVAGNSYDGLIAKVRSGRYVGLHRVGPVRCHHLLFIQENVNWQIWIAADGQPLPQRIVITHKKRAGEPQYIATLNDWRLNDPMADSEFAFTAPPGSQEVDILPAKQP